MWIAFEVGWVEELHCEPTADGGRPMTTRMQRRDNGRNGNQSKYTIQLNEESETRSPRSWTHVSWDMCDATIVALRLVHTDVSQPWPGRTALAMLNVKQHNASVCLSVEPVKRDTSTALPGPSGRLVDELFACRYSGRGVGCYTPSSTSVRSYPRYTATHGHARMRMMHLSSGTRSC
jgi:hypothetical protein